MKEVDTSISLEAMIDCPHCEEYFNLFDIQRLIDDAYIYTELLGEPHWGKENWNEVVSCPKCKQDIMIKNVEW